MINDTDIDNLIIIHIYFVDKAERKRNRVYSDDEDFDPNSRNQKRCKLDNSDDDSEEYEVEEVNEHGKGKQVIYTLPFFQIKLFTI